VTPQAPPFLIAYSTQDPAWLERQNELLWRALHRNGVPTELRRVSTENHYSLALALSRAGPVTEAVVSFVAGRRALARVKARGPMLGVGQTPPPDGG
jgi:hypothetical protein